MNLSTDTDDVTFSTRPRSHTEATLLPASRCAPSSRAIRAPANTRSRDTFHGSRPSSVPRANNNLDPQFAMDVVAGIFEAMNFVKLRDDVALLEPLQNAATEGVFSVATGAADAAFEFDCGRNYSALGRWRGALSDAETQQSARDFWVRAGELGARWLIRRTSNETNVDVLSSVLDTLVAQGVDALAPSFEELSSRQLPYEAAELLLGAVERIVEAHAVPDADQRLFQVAKGYAERAEPDVREAAYRLMAVINGDDARAYLATRLAQERDPDLRGLLADLDSRSHG